MLNLLVRRIMLISPTMALALKGSQFRCQRPW
jgi:hypothetical protein